MVCTPFKPDHHHIHIHTYLGHVLVNGVYDGQRASSHLIEHPVDVLSEVPVLLAGEGEVMEEHLEPLMCIIHAQVVKARPARAPGKFPVLEPRGVQDVDVGPALGQGAGRGGRLEGAVEEEYQRGEGLLVQAQHKGVKGGGAVGGVVLGGGAVLGGFLFPGPLPGVEEGGEAEGLALWGVEDVLGQLLVVDAQEGGCSLGSTGVQEPVVGARLT